LDQENAFETNIAIVPVVHALAYVVKRSQCASGLHWGWN